MDRCGPQAGRNAGKRTGGHGLADDIYPEDPDRGGAARPGSGRVLRDVCTVEGYFNASQFSYQNTDYNIYDCETSRGGALQWIGPHWMDMMPWILDDPIAQVNARMHDAEDCDVEAGAVLQFETRDGTLGTYHTG